jgi:hypothetical protein
MVLEYESGAMVHVSVLEYSSTDTPRAKLHDAPPCHIVGAVAR